jgi:thioredoxin 1
MKQIIVLFLLLLVGIGSAFAESTEFTQEKFKQAQEDGKVILLDFYASWCSTCKAQQPILESLLEKEKFSNVVAFKVDYDSEKELKKIYNVTSQSTLIVLKNNTEVGRSIGSTNKESIQTLLEKGL